MALTATQKRTLNNLSNYIPELRKHQYTAADSVALGDILDALHTGIVTITAPATADAVVTAVVNATDLASSEALANDLKAKWNAAVPLINELKAILVAAAAS